MGRRAIAARILHGYILRRSSHHGKQSPFARKINTLGGRPAPFQPPCHHQASQTSSTTTPHPHRSSAFISIQCKTSGFSVVADQWKILQDSNRPFTSNAAAEESSVGSGLITSTGIYRSLRKRVQIPDDPFLSLPSFLFSHEENSEKVALIDAPSGREVTFGELKQQVLALAAGLARVGVKQGDVVMMVLPNSIEYPVIFLAVMWMGAVITPVNPLNKAFEIETLVKDSNPKLIVTVAEEVEKVERLGLPLVILGQKAEAEKLSKLFSSSIVTLGELLNSDPCEAPGAFIRQSDTAALMYSSGTTGLCKGVVWSHRNIIAATLQFNETPPQADEVGVCILPMYHTFGFCIITCTHFRRGTPLVVIPRFDLEELLHYIERYRLSSITVVPPILVSIAKSTILHKYDLSTLRAIECGAAPLGKEVMDICRSRLPGVKFKQVYGLTESSGISATTPPNDSDGIHGHVGKLASNMEAKVVDVETGKCLPPNQSGELLVRGPCVMSGYLKNPEATAAALDSDHWLHTGDLVFFDCNGYLFVVDRIKELIKYKGLQVAPAEIEAILLSHPLIRDAAVIPFPDEEAGQIPMAVVVQSVENGLTEDQVMNFAAEQVSPHKKVRRVHFVESIPKTPSGKILRRKLADMASKME